MAGRSFDRAARLRCRFTWFSLFRDRHVNGTLSCPFDKKYSEEFLIVYLHPVSFFS
jgi:hypothetical protein